MAALTETQTLTIIYTHRPLYGMATEVLVKSGTPVIVANTSDYTGNIEKRLLALWPVSKVAKND